MTPEGAFYLFADIRGTELGSEAFSDELRATHRVAVVSGTAFGRHGEGFIRLSYAADEQTLHTALAGIQAFTQTLQSCPSRSADPSPTPG